MVNLKLIVIAIFAMMTFIVCVCRRPMRHENGEWIRDTRDATATLGGCFIVFIGTMALSKHVILMGVILILFGTCQILNALRANVLRAARYKMHLKAFLEHDSFTVIGTQRVAGFSMLPIAFHHAPQHTICFRILTRKHDRTFRWFAICWPMRPTGFWLWSEAQSGEQPPETSFGFVTEHGIAADSLRGMAIGLVIVIAIVWALAKLLRALGVYRW